MAGDINFRPSKHGDFITLTEPLEKYTYICDQYLKTRKMTLIGVSLIGCQLYMVSMGFENILKIFVPFPLVFTVYQLYMIKKSGTSGLFVFNQKILPLIERDH